MDMKLLWIIVCAIVLGAGAVLVIKPGSGPAATPSREDVPRASRPDRSGETPKETTEQPPKEDAPPADEPAPVPLRIPETPSAPVIQTPTVISPQAVTPPVGAPPPITIEAPKEEAAPKPVETPKPETPKPVEAKPVEAPKPEATNGNTPFVIPDAPNFPTDKIVAAKAEKKPDGTIVLDGRFAVKGSGTETDPYRVPWDLLLSAQETYRPRVGQLKLPQRVTMLDGKWVTISGFTAFPLTAQDPKEMLAMLNQWDGCCIGIPPTPYDAIEVRLAKKPTEAVRLAAHGTVTGKLRVDPYEDGGWLLGLYLMEEATMKPDE